MRPDFIEIGTDDHGVTKGFFGALFDWSWVPMNGGPAGYFEDGERQVGLHAGDTPSVVPYIAVSDIDVMVQKVRDLGGTIMGSVAEAPGLGRFASCKDPRGARFGLHQKI